MFFCGVDVGTSGVKAVVFNEKGTFIASAHYEYKMALGSGVTRGIDAHELWDKTKKAIKDVNSQIEGNIETICVDTFGEAFVMLDDSDNILNEIMIYTDPRGEDEYNAAMQHVSDDEIAHICGLPHSPTYSISKMLYMKQNAPEIYGKAKRILFIEDFVGYMLCGNAAVDWSLAVRTMLFDINKHEWSDSLMGKFGIDRALLSRTVPTGTVIGELSDKIAAETGISGKVKIVAGGHDQPISAIGAGLRKGEYVDSLGTSECLTPVFDGRLHKDITLNSGMPSEPMWTENKFCTLAYNPSCGFLVNWFMSTFAAAESRDGNVPYGIFEKNFPSNPTKLLVQPYLVGSGTPSLDQFARMAITGIDPSTTRYDIYRACLEALSLDICLCTEILEGQGIKSKRIIVVGGGSKSNPWLKVKADIMQLPVSTLSCSEAAALGGAIVGAYASGAYSSIEEAAANMSTLKDTIEPDPGVADFYNEKFEIYKQLRGHLAAESEFAAK